LKYHTIFMVAVMPVAVATRLLQLTFSGAVAAAAAAAAG
jgi:hypothetical protein